MGTRTSSNIRVIHRQRRDITSVVESSAESTNILEDIVNRTNTDKTGIDSLMDLSQMWSIDTLYKGINQLFKNNLSKIAPAIWGGTGGAAEEICSDIFTYQEREFRVLAKRDAGEVKSVYLMLVPKNYRKGSKAFVTMRASKNNYTRDRKVGYDTEAGEDRILWSVLLEISKEIQKTNGRIHF